MIDPDLSSIKEILQKWDKENQSESPYWLSTYNCYPSSDDKQSHKSKSRREGLFAFLKRNKDRINKIEVIV